MKKAMKVLICLLMCFSFTGCFSSLYTRSANNDLDEVCKECKNVTNIEILVDNVENSMRQVNAIRGNYQLNNTKGTYDITFDIIAKEKRIDWDLYAKVNYDDKDITLYFKNQKFYIIYPNNGANVIIKDSIKNLFIEAEDSLEKLNATYNKDNLNNLMMGDKLEGFNFQGMKETATYTKNKNDTYTITYKENGLEWQYDISENYLIVETRCKAENFDSTLTFDYPNNLSIVYPMALDFLTIDIDEVKDLLDVDSFAEIIDGDEKSIEEQVL